jgi:hypothetical protein
MQIRLTARKPHGAAPWHDNCTFMQHQINVKQGTLETIAEKQPRLVDQLRRCIRDKHYALSASQNTVTRLAMRRGQYLLQVIRARRFRSDESDRWSANRFGACLWAWCHQELRKPSSDAGLRQDSNPSVVSLAATKPNQPAIVCRQPI